MRGALPPPRFRLYLSAPLAAAVCALIHVSTLLFSVSLSVVCARVRMRACVRVLVCADISEDAHGDIVGGGPRADCVNQLAVPLYDTTTAEGAQASGGDTRVRTAPAHAVMTHTRARACVCG